MSKNTPNSPMLDIGDSPVVRAAAKASARRLDPDLSMLRQLEEMQATMQDQGRRLQEQANLINELTTEQDALIKERTTEQDAPKPKANPTRRVSMACNNNNNNNENNNNNTRNNNENNNNTRSHDLAKSRVTAIQNAAMTTSRLKLCRESYNLWRRAVHQYCRVALNADIGTGPGWTIPWTPHYDEYQQMVYPTWFTQSHDDDLYDFICTTTDPQHEQRINQNNPNRSGLHALYNICQQYKESALTTLQRGLAALRTLPQQTSSHDGDAYTLYATQLGNAVAILKELPPEYDLLEGLAICAIIDTAPNTAAVNAILQPVLTGTVKADSLAILEQIRSSCINFKLRQQPLSKTALIAATKATVPGTPPAPGAPRTYTHNCFRCNKGPHLVIDCPNPAEANWHARVPTIHKERIPGWEAKIASKAAKVTPALSGYPSSARPDAPPAAVTVLPALPALLTTQDARSLVVYDTGCASQPLSNDESLFTHLQLFPGNAYMTAGKVELRTTHHGTLRLPIRTVEGTVHADFPDAEYSPDLPCTLVGRKALAQHGWCLHDSLHASTAPQLRGTMPTVELHAHDNGLLTLPLALQPPSYALAVTRARSTNNTTNSTSPTSPTTNAPLPPRSITAPNNATNPPPPTTHSPLLPPRSITAPINALPPRSQPPTDNPTAQLQLPWRRAAKRSTRTDGGATASRAADGGATASATTSAPPHQPPDGGAAAGAATATDGGAHADPPAPIPYSLAHTRLAHFLHADAHQLARAVDGLSITSPVGQACPTCNLTKSKLTSVPRGGNTPARTFTLEPHTGTSWSVDLIGRKITAADGSMAAAVCVDKATGFVLSLLIKDRSNVFLVLQRLLRQLRVIGRPSAAMTITITTDHEFLTTETLAWAAQNNVLLKPSVSNEHWSNGVAERYIQTLADATAAVLRPTRLDKQLFWPYALLHATHVSNCTRVIDGHTPFERWHGYRPDLRHVRVFGCAAIYHRFGAGPGTATKSTWSDKGAVGIYLGAYQAGDVPGTFGNAAIWPLTESGATAACLDRRVFCCHETAFPSSSDPHDQAVTALLLNFDGLTSNHPMFRGATSPAAGHISDLAGETDEELFTFPTHPTPAPLRQLNTDVDPPAIARTQRNTKSTLTTIPDAKPRAPPRPSAPREGSKTRSQTGRPLVAFIRPAQPAATAPQHIPIPQSRYWRRHLDRLHRQPATHLDSSYLDRVFPITPTLLIVDPSTSDGLLLDDSAAPSGARLLTFDDLTQRKLRAEDSMVAASGSTAAPQRVFAPNPITNPPTTPSSSYKLHELPADQQALWRAAERAEWHGMMHVHQSFNPTPIPIAVARAQGPVLPYQWVYKYKPATGQCKARLTMRGDLEDDVSFDTFSPTVTYDLFSFTAAVGLKRRWKTAQWDTPQAFLNAKTNRPIFLRPPPFINGFPKDHVLELYKSVYGLTDAGLRWYLYAVKRLKRAGLRQSRVHPCIFYSDDCILSLYVDDYFVWGSSWAYIDSLKAALKSVGLETTETRGHGTALGMNWTWSETNNTLELSFLDTERALLAAHDMTDCLATDCPAIPESVLPFVDSGEHPNYRGLVGSLQHLCHLRSEIRTCVRDLGRHSSANNDVHWRAALRVLRYIKGTLGRTTTLSAVTLPPSTTDIVPPIPAPVAAGLCAWSDSTWAGCPTTRLAVSGYVLQFNGHTFATSSRTQATTARSSGQAELVAASDTSLSIVNYRNLLRELGEPLETPTPLILDSQVALSNLHTPLAASMHKHIDNRRLAVADLVFDGALSLHWVPSGLQLADAMTKNLPIASFTKFAHITHNDITTDPS